MTTSKANIPLRDAIEKQLPKMLVFDLDGTVVAGTDKVAEAVISQLQKLTSRGIQVAVATGRPWFGAKHIVQTLSPTGVGMFSGGSHFVNMRQATDDKVIALPKDSLSKLNARARELGIYTELYTSHEYYSSQKNEIYEIHSEYLKKHAILVDSLESVIDSNEILKMVLVGNTPQENDQQHVLAAEFPNLSFSFSYGAAHRSMLFGNIAAKEASRANAFEYLCRSHAVKPEEVYCFGDSPADATFIKLAGIGFAVGSQHAEATDAADFVLPHVDEGGVLEVLNELARVI